MADYGSIGAFLGSDAVISPRIDRDIDCFSVDGNFFTTLENRRLVLIDALVIPDVIGIKMAPDIDAVIGIGFAQMKKTLLAPWAFDYIAHQREKDALPDTTGVIRGFVEADAERVQYIKVHLYYNPTGEKISTTITNENGEFEFLGLTVGSTQYTVMAALDQYNNARETRMAAVTA